MQKKKFPNLLSIVCKFKLNKKNEIYKNDKNETEMDCYNLVKD